jgi:hypothetical protein
MAHELVVEALGEQEPGAEAGVRVLAREAPAPPGPRIRPRLTERAHDRRGRSERERGRAGREPGADAERHDGRRAERGDNGAASAVELHR